MEGIVHQKQILFPLFKDSTIKTTTMPIITKELPAYIGDLKQLNRQYFGAKNKLKIVKKNHQNLIWKKPFKLRKTLITKNKNIKRFFLRYKLKNNISQTYRTFFYNNEYKRADPQIFISTQFKNIRRPSLISRKIIKQEINYLDILKLINKTELSFFNKNIRPRYLSSYWFPDSKNNRRFAFSSIDPLIINIHLPGKYKSFFIESFSKILKKQKRFLQEKK